ncbi:dual specificity protein kinase YAK1 [Pancytospora philotis]|nr:dual specificity protein kinase YAK1 [Pancytospora philotis]
MKRFLTNPSECVFNPHDNVDGNLVAAKGDSIVKSDAVQYMIVELLGVGTFGQVFRCVSNEGNEVAIKVVKGANKYYQYEMNEVRILKKFKDAGLTDYFVELHDAFIYKNHLCIVLELLGKNMYDLGKILRFNGMEFYSVQQILRQVLEGLGVLHSMGITHCDIKPENILVADFYSEKIKIVDFGSSTTRPLSTVYYVQSRYYRAPEVILGIPYSMVVDVWSLGCIAYELLMGHPLFPGRDNADQIYLVHEFCPAGLPLFMLEHGAHSHHYFKKESGFFGRYNPSPVTLHEVVGRIRAKFHGVPEIELFIDLLVQMLNPSYLERPSPRAVLSHPFFEISRPVLNSPFPRERLSRSSSAKNTGGAGRARKMSMYDYSNTQTSTLPLQRKGSVYDPSLENRDNCLP